MADGERYPSDTIDEQWVVLEPLVPAPLPGGRPAVHSRRRIVDAILYVNRTGCSWWQLPHDFPPWATVFWYFKRWRADGVVDRIHDALRDRVRDAEDWDPMASAGCLDHDYERLPDTSEAMIKWAMIGLMVRRLAPPAGRTPWQRTSTAA